MKQLIALVKRNVKEALRDPLTIIFCVAFPVLMLVFMQIIFTNMEFTPENFQIKHYAAGICVFGYTFTALFTAMNIAGDKNTSFIKRITISPIKKFTYLFSFTLSGLPIAFCQTLLFYCIALAFGLPFDANWALSILYLLPSAILYLAIGTLVGVICKHEKQTGPISSILISATGLLGGVFMPLSSFAGGFAQFVNALPFSHSVLIASELHTIGTSCFFPHVFFVVGYVILLWAASLLIERLKKAKFFKDAFKKH